jgi:hypothetical protein
MYCTLSPFFKMFGVMNSRLCTVSYFEFHKKKHDWLNITIYVKQTEHSTGFVIYIYTYKMYILLTLICVQTQCLQLLVKPYPSLVV